MTSFPSGRSRRIPLVLVAVGIVLIAVTLVLVRHNAPAPTDAGQLPVVPVTAGTATSADPKSSTAPPPTSISAPAASLAASTSEPATVPTTAPSMPPTFAPAAAPPKAAQGRPTVLHLPTLNITAHIDPVDSTDGVLQVPDDVSRVGWWQHSADAGSTAGSTVIDGHIDSAVTGEGALFNLADLAPGDPLSVTTSVGSTIHYQVQARRVYVKEDGLPAELFSQQGPARLVIISCGGTFDKATRSYEENVAVFATPIT